MAQLALGGTRRARRPLAAVVVDRVWRFFCSVRAAMYEIAFLAILVLLGTLKGSVIPAQIPRYVPALDPLVTRWYRFDVFHSLIFSLTLALLAVAIVACTLNRVPGIWRSIARPRVLTTRHFFLVVEPAVALRSAGSPEVVAGEVVRLLKSRRYRVLSERHGAEIHVFADKHRFGKLGTFPFHLALILILVGGIVGSELGFRETAFTVAEGEIRNVERGTGLRLGLDRFVDRYSQIGAPTAYRSDVVLYDGEREVRRASLTVNDPLTYDGVTFYQAPFGQAAAIRVADAADNVIFDQSVPFEFVATANMDAPAAVVDLPAQGIGVELIFPSTVTLPVVLGMVVYVWSLPPGVRDDRGQIPALVNPPLLTAHVSSAVVSYAAFALSFAAAVIYLVVDRWPRSWLPSAELLDDVAFRAVTVGFPAQLMLLILGALWAHQAWGGYWSWDPEETAALFTWLVYGVYLHARSLRGWRGRRSAWLLIASFATVVFTYFGNYWFGGLHAYSGM